MFLYYMISFGFIYNYKMVFILQSWGGYLLFLLLFLKRILGVILKYFVVSKEFFFHIFGYAWLLVGVFFFFASAFLLLSAGLSIDPINIFL